MLAVHVDIVEAGCYCHHRENCRQTELDPSKEAYVHFQGVVNGFNASDRRDGSAGEADEDEQDLDQGLRGVLQHIVKSLGENEETSKSSFLQIFFLPHLEGFHRFFHVVFVQLLL